MEAYRFADRGQRPSDRLVTRIQLILEAGVTGEGGEVLVLDMGEQVKTIDVAKTLIRLSGRGDVEITLAGLRPGEKVSEDLFSGAEQGKGRANPLILSVGVPGLSGEAVRAVGRPSPGQAAGWMRVATATTGHVSALGGKQ